MTVKVANAKTTVSLIDIRIENLENLMLNLEDHLENPDVRKLYNDASSKIEVLREVYESLHGNHISLKI